MVKKVLSLKNVSIAEVREILEGREQELDVLQQRVLSYTRKFSKIPPGKAKELVDQLVEKYGLLEEEAVQVVNICPTTVEELRSVLSGYKRLVSFLLFSEEKMRGVVELVKEALKTQAKG